MPTLADFTAADAAATPVTHTFKARRVNGDLATFREESAAYPIGYWNVGMSLKDPATGNGGKIYRQKLTFDMPITTVETINGVSVPKVAYTLRFTGEALLPSDSSTQNRKDFRKLIVGIIDSTLFKAEFEDVDPIHG